MEKSAVNIAIIGLGTVGGSVLKILLKERISIEQRIGTKINLSYICDINTKRLATVRHFTTTTDYRKVISDPKVDIVIELIGGETIAKEIIIKSLTYGKHIVTANKYLLANYWDRIFTLANKFQRLVYFEASVGSGIPVIQALNEGLAANKILRIIGILNGTANYILTKMTEKSIPFEHALQEAQSKGLAEKKPLLDIKGYDTLHKLCILSSIALGCYVKPDQSYCEGIDNIDLQDIRYAYDKFNFVTKLLGIYRVHNNKIELQVRPCLISQNSVFATVANEYNAILLEGDACGDIVLYGKGAGGEAAASAVVSDIIFLARQIVRGVAGKIPYIRYEIKKINYLKKEHIDGYYYLRFTAVDRPGVLSCLSGILAKHKVSIASIYQKEQLFKVRRGVPILMLTHRTKEGALLDAINQIDRLPIILKRTVLLRIEDV